MRPNIFNIATKELSQDAFITWLLLWADPKNKNEDALMNRCGQDFVKELINKPDLVIAKVEAGRQWNNVDIWAEINSKYLIIIEDKTFTGEHSNQLESYKTMAFKYATDKDMELYCIYLKTGSESSVYLQRVKDKGYKIYSRTNLLELLNRHKEIKNDIYQDFGQRMNQLENALTLFESKPIKDWDKNFWPGLFQYLEKNLPIKTCGWHYVDNPSGGFWNMCMNWQNYGSFPVYFQLEEKKICFKISTHPDDIEIQQEINRSLVRNQWYAVLKSKAEEAGLTEILKPKNFGYGNYMTVAQIASEHWLGNEDEIIDKVKVIENILKYDTWFKEMVSTLIPIEKAD